MSGMHVDPLYTEAKAVVDATGHDAEVVSVAARKVPELGIVIQGEKSGYSELSEKLVVKHAGRVAPGVSPLTVFPLAGLGLGVGSPASPTPHGPRSSPNAMGLPSE